MQVHIIINIYIYIPTYILQSLHNNNIQCSDYILVHSTYCTCIRKLQVDTLILLLLCQETSFCTMFVFHAHKQTACIQVTVTKNQVTTPRPVRWRRRRRYRCARCRPRQHVYIYIYYLRYTRHYCTCKQRVLGDGGNTVSPKININIIQLTRTE